MLKSIMIGTSLFVALSAGTQLSAAQSTSQQPQGAPVKLTITPEGFPTDDSYEPAVKCIATATSENFKDASCSTNPTSNKACVITLADGGTYKVGCEYKFAGSADLTYNPSSQNSWTITYKDTSILCANDGVNDSCSL